MCGRFVITSPPEALRHIFGYAQQPNLPPRFNIAPTQPVAVVIIENNIRHFRLMRWGLLPAWVKDIRKFTVLINARSETAREKPAFKNAIKRRRCLIPADGYYEWQTSEQRKRPYFIYRRDRLPIGLAGLAETWIGPNGEKQDTVAIVTAPASAGLAVLHHRVPVTIPLGYFGRWLDCNANDVDAVMPLMRGPDHGEFVWHEVSTRVNRVANDDAQLLLPITTEEREDEEALQSLEKTNPRKAAAVPQDSGQGSLF